MRVRFTTQITKRQFYILVFLLAVLMLVFFYGVRDKEPKCEESVEDYTVSQEPDSVAEELEEEYTDPNNYIYPFNTMSADWGSELYESGFKYYQIPEKYTQEGGCFPEVVQAYLWSLCKEREINYYVVVALIERESRYKWYSSGDDGNSKGYMQIYEKWHIDRMEAEGATDLYNPYENIRVGLNFLQELTDGAVNADYHYVLMSYNMGESRAKEFNYKGVYSSEYSTGILWRAQEIQQELQEQE